MPLKLRSSIRSCRCRGRPACVHVCVCAHLNIAEQRCGTGNATIVHYLGEWKWEPHKTKTKYCIVLSSISASFRQRCSTKTRTQGPGQIATYGKGFHQGSTDEWSVRYVTHDLKLAYTSTGIGRSLQDREHSIPCKAERSTPINQFVSINQSVNQFYDKLYAVHPSRIKPHIYYTGCMKFFGCLPANWKAQGMPDTRPTTGINRVRGGSANTQWTCTSCLQMESVGDARGTMINDENNDKTRLQDGECGGCQ